MITFQLSAKKFRSDDNLYSVGLGAELASFFSFAEVIPRSYEIGCDCVQLLDSTTIQSCNVHPQPSRELTEGVLMAFWVVSVHALTDVSRRA
jgi:hypothetical protein